MLREGIKGEIRKVVTNDDTAVVYKSGEAEVYATPAMAALMEETAWMSIKPYLDEEESSVGTMLCITHISPTPIGMSVVCQSHLVTMEGKKLVFELRVEDEKGLIGEGTHERVIVEKEKFQTKANKKAETIK
ncbi:MAG: thioesterase family protein [Lachnospiraceae bacterium]